MPPSAASTETLRIEALTKSYGQVRALRDVSFSARAGEVLGVIGPNGAGKTTLFECVARLLPFDEGAFRHEGRELTGRDHQSLIFYLPDAIAPWPAQSVRWALDFAVGFLGGSSSLVAEVVEQLDLRPLLAAKIGALSKGQRKRALLGVGLLTPHPILLIDEPFDGLDLRQSRDIGSALRRHAASGRTIILSIHQISDAARVCDRFVLLSNGRICGEGTLAELAARVSTGTGTAADLEEVFLALT